MRIPRVSTVFLKCVCEWVCEWMSVYMYVYKSEWVCMNECIYVYVCESEWVYVCVCVNEYMCVWDWMNVWVNEYVYEWVCICICVWEWMNVWVNECVYEWVYMCVWEWMSVNQCMSVHEWVCMCVRVNACVSVCVWGSLSRHVCVEGTRWFLSSYSPLHLVSDPGTCCWGWLAGHLTLGSLCLHPISSTLFTWLLGSKFRPSRLCGKCSTQWAIFQSHRTDLKVRIHPDSGLSSFSNVLNYDQGVLVNNGKFQINLCYCFALFIQEFFFSAHRAVPNVKYEWQTVLYIYTSFSCYLEI